MIFGFMKCTSYNHKHREKFTSDKCSSLHFSENASAPQSGALASKEGFGLELFKLPVNVYIPIIFHIQEVNSLCQCTHIKAQSSNSFH